MSEGPHIASKTSYVGVLLALLALTAATVWVAMLDFGFLNTPIALAIAGLKAGLVILYFMHLRYSPPLIVLVALAGLLWLAILFALTLADYFTRPDILGW